MKIKMDSEITIKSLLNYNKAVEKYNQIKNSNTRIETTEEFKILPYDLQKIFIQEYGLYI